MMMCRITTKLDSGNMRVSYCDACDLQMMLEADIRDGGTPMTIEYSQKWSGLWNEMIDFEKLRQN